MSAPAIGRPGTRRGPDPNCSCQDCELARRQAACVCPACGEVIGYDAPYHVIGSPLDLCHKGCLMVWAKGRGIA